MTIIDTRELTAVLDRLSALEDEQHIRTLVTRMGTLVDARDWAACAALFTDPVHADWSALGGQAELISPTELVAGWQHNLAGFAATHHLIAGHDIAVDGDRASCVSYVLGTHRMDTPLGGNLWTVGGRYEHDLTRTPGGWRITSAALRPTWGSGNQHLALLAGGGTS